MLIENHDFFSIFKLQEKQASEHFIFWPSTVGQGK